MSSIKQLLWEDKPKPKRDFIKENAKRFKDVKTQSLRSSNQTKRPQNTISLINTRMLKPNLSHQHSPTNKARVTAMPHGTLSHRRPLRAYPVKRSVQPVQPDEINFGRLSLRQDKPLVKLSAKNKDGPKGFRNQACQTLQDKDLDSLSYDDVIRYPSSRCYRQEEFSSPRKVCVREMGLQTEDVHFRSCQKAAGDVLDQSKLVNKGSVDHVKLNLTAPLKSKQINIEKPDPIRAPSTYQKGVLPKYLREQKKDKENEKEEKTDVLAVDGVTAQMLLPDDMRKKLLTKLKKDHKELVDQLNQLPFSTSSLKTLQRKQQIEKDLDFLEKRITNFSREKVFIRDIQ